MTQIPPATGERRAVGGYYSQYRIASELILRQLRDGTLRWIRVADPQAGRVDDLQIGIESRVDAFQVKSSQYGGNFSFNDLTHGSGSQPSLVAQLADGWNQLRAIRPGYRIVVHLISNQIPSVADHLPADSSPPSPLHFSAFLEQAWKPAHAGLLGSGFGQPSAWAHTWEALRASSGLHKPDFEAFIRDSELEFGYQQLAPEEIEGRAREIFRADLDHISQFLFKTVADPKKVIELTRDQLLAGLEWTTRFEFTSRHEFPVDEVLYFPIKESVRQLEHALETLPGGYLGVLGTPGSGKSSLGTQTLRHRSDRTIRYYAFVPDAQDPSVLRGESENFLHDMVLAIERAGFRVGTSPSRFDRTQLLERFHKQLNLLHQNWETTGRKTVIFIDGLDHIDREQHPNRSLLQDLPRPNQVPDGVYIALGSQTDAPFPDLVQFEVRQAERRVEIRPLSREGVFQVIERVRLGELSQDQKESIYVLSAGHPLALSYLLNRVREVNEPRDIQAILDGTEPYRGNILAQYHSYWRQIEGDTQLVNLLGLVARLRRVIDLSWVETWTPHAVVDQLRFRFAHYFRREDNNRWYFFHNSFRLFLAERTAESSPGVVDPLRDRAFHHKLAGICADMPPESPWAWEALHHLVKAEEHEAVLRCASQRWFRNQILAFRPLDSIQTDLGLAYQAIGVKKDFIALTRMTLLKAEMYQREFHLNDISFIPSLLAIGEKHTALEHVRDGNRLRLEAEDALQISVVLKRAGLLEEAKRVFDLADPLDLFEGAKPISDVHLDEDRKRLEAWAETASHFREIETLIKTIRRVRGQAGRMYRQDEAAASRSLHNNLLSRVAFSLIDQERWEDLLKIQNEFDRNQPEDRGHWFWVQVEAWRDCSAAGHQLQARSYLEEAIANSTLAELEDEQCAIIASAVYRLLGDEQRARSFVKGLRQPSVQTELYHGEEGFQPFEHRFILNRLLTAFGNNQSAREIVPDPSEPRHWGVVYFERAISIIAKLWGEAWRGRIVNDAMFVHEIEPILRLFNRSLQDTQDWIPFPRGKAREALYDLLIDTATLHGSEAVTMLRDAFQQHWDNSDTRPYWQIDLQRRIVLSLYRAGIAREWAAERLKAFEASMLEGTDSNARTDACMKQAKAWLALDDKSAARRLLLQMLQVSFGIRYKGDYQLDTWVHWLGKVNEIEPAKAGERIKWFAGDLFALEGTTESDAPRSAINELLAVTFKWSPRKSVRLFQWFLEQGLINHNASASLLLKEALESNSPPRALVQSCLVDILIPIGAAPLPSLIDLLIEQASASGPNGAIQLAREILAVVRFGALPSSRLAWRQSIARALRKVGINFHSVDLSLSDLKPEKEDRSSSSSSLNLKDGSSISAEEIEMTVTSASDLRSLLEREADGSFFNWRSVVTQLLPTLDRQSVQEIAILLEGSRRTTHILGALSERLAELGDNSGAWELAQRSLEASDPNGWSRWYDGGTRIAAFSALIKASPERARPMLFETLVQGGGGGADNLEKLMPMLLPIVPVRELWSEIEEYLHALFLGLSTASVATPDFLTELFKDDTPALAIADLIMLHLEHPTTPAMRWAWGTCAKLQLDHNANIEKMIGEWLNGTEERQEHSLRVLDSVSLKAPSSIVPFHPQVILLQHSPNYEIRRIACVICSRAGITPVVSSSVQDRPLPEIYRLALPPVRSRDIEVPRVLSKELPLPDSTDPLEIIRPFDFHLNLLSSIARLPKANLYHRAVQLMEQLSPKESWSAAAEQKLRWFLDACDLKYVFHRPRAVLARKAVFHIIAELIDSKVVTSEQLKSIEVQLCFYDPMMVLLRPNPRPSCVGTLSGISEHGGVEKTWTETVSESLGATCSTTADGRTLLAEDTILKRLDWGGPEETRRSVLRTGVSVHDEKRFFKELSNNFVAEYPDLGIATTPRPLIVRHGDFITYDSPGKYWLALNPAVAHDMGWTLSNTGMFRWVDDSGQTMVESIWWIDGLVEQSGPVFPDNEVGEGWLVLAARAAGDLISKHFGQLQQYRMVERSQYEKDQGTLRHSATDNLPFILPAS